MNKRIRPPLGAIAAAALLLLGGCAPQPRHGLSPDDTIRAAQQQLADTCLTEQGLTPPRPGRRTGSSPAEETRISDALFGSGRTELSLALPTGYVVRAHTDGCLAAAQRSLYGDQRRWFRVATVVNNLKAEAAHRHTSLDAVRDSHRAELADWRRMRVHALGRARQELLRRATATERRPAPSPP